MQKIKCNTLLEPNEIFVNFYINTSPKYSYFFLGARLNFTSLYVIYRNFTLSIAASNALASQTIASGVTAFFATPATPVTPLDWLHRLHRIQRLYRLHRYSDYSVAPVTPVLHHYTVNAVAPATPLQRNSILA